MKATAQMGGLTREQINSWRTIWVPSNADREELNKLCDLALQALSESVRSEALEKAANRAVHVLAEIMDSHFGPHRHFECAKCEKMAVNAIDGLNFAIRSLSPARVAEGEITRCSVSFEHPPHDYCDGNPGAKFLPESPAKEHPGEQTVAFDFDFPEGATGASMRRYQVIYTTTGFDQRYEGPFNTFDEAKAWAVKNCSGWWTISNYYD